MFETFWRTPTHCNAAVSRGLSRITSSSFVSTTDKFSWITDLLSFLANVTFAICCRPSVRLSVCLSVCRLSVTLVHLTQAVVIFGNISTAFGTFAIRWHPRKILRRSSQRNPSVEGAGVNARGVAKYSDFGPIESYISETVQDRR